MALVMAGAISIAFVAFRVAGKRAISLTGARMNLPKARQRDAEAVLSAGNQRRNNHAFTLMVRVVRICHRLS